MRMWFKFGTGQKMLGKMLVGGLDARVGFPDIGSNEGTANVRLMSDQALTIRSN